MNPANPGMVIRNETDADIGAITEVTIAAFESLQISNHTNKSGDTLPISLSHWLIEGVRIHYSMGIN